MPSGVSTQENNIRQENTIEIIRVDFCPPGRLLPTRTVNQLNNRRKLLGNKYRLPVVNSLSGTAIPAEKAKYISQPNLSAVVDVSRPKNTMPNSPERRNPRDTARIPAAAKESGSTCGIANGAAYGLSVICDIAR